MATRPLIPYGRKSSGEDTEQSLARQRGAIQRWAATNRERLDEFVFEAHVSGSKRWQDRALGKIVERVRRGEASGIVVEEQSRLTRGNQLQVAELWEALDESGARLVCVSEGIDTARGDEELNFGLHALLAREQWKQYARRVEASKEHAVMEKGVPIGFAPFGYKREPHEPLEVDEPAASAVRQAFELRASGASILDVTNLLNEIAPGGPSKKKGTWISQTVKNLLANRTYLGEARGGGYVKPGAHEALTDPTTFEACASHARTEPKRPRGPSHHSLLGGLVYCAHCGHKMSAGPTANGYRVYRCRRVHAKDEKPCPTPATAMQPALEQLVDETMIEWLRREALPIETKAEPDPDDSDLHAKLAKLRAKREPFEDPDYVDQLGAEAAKRALKKLDDEIDALDDELAERISRRGSSLDLPNGIEPVSFYLELRQTDALSEMLGLKNGTGAPLATQARDFLKLFIERIVVSRPKPRTQPLVERVEIVWKDV